MTTTVGGNNIGNCGMIHGPLCPFVKVIEYYENGGVKRVEYREVSPAQLKPWGGKVEFDRPSQEVNLA